VYPFPASSAPVFIETFAIEMAWLEMGGATSGTSGHGSIAIKATCVY
jgi:hypothetical protein